MAPAGTDVHASALERHVVRCHCRIKATPTSETPEFLRLLTAGSPASSRERGKKSSVLLCGFTRYTGEHRRPWKPTEACCMCTSTHSPKPARSHLVCVTRPARSFWGLGIGNRGVLGIWAAPVAPGPPLDRPDPPHASSCTTNQPRRPILRPYRDDLRSALSSLGLGGTGDCQRGPDTGCS